MKKRTGPTLRVFMASVAILAIILVGVLGAGVFAPTEALTIAVVGPMTGPDQAAGLDMVRSINLHLDEVNRGGGVNGKPVRLLTFDDRSNTDQARQRAVEIAEQNKALVVIGHLFSSTSSAAGPVYKEHRIPAISGSATAEGVTADNEWYFRTIFSNRVQASYLANYVRQVLKKSTVSIVYDEDDYGASLAATFDAKFRELGGTIKYQWSFDSQKGSADSALTKITQELTRVRGDDPGMIFIAAHANESEKIVAAIRRQGLGYPIVGADSMGDDAFAAQFKGYAEEQSHPGYFTDGIYATAPMIFDVAGEKAQQVMSNYRAKYGSDPGWTVTAYYDAAVLAVQAMRMAGVQGDPGRLAEDRREIRDRLAAVNRIEEAIEGAGGHLYFDEARSVSNSVYMGIFAKGQFISAMVQLRPVANVGAISDLQNELDAEQILKVDGRYVYKTRVVYTGVDLNQVTHLDTKTSTYNMDFYLWFRYQGQFDDGNIEFINADKEVKSGKPVEEVTADDVTYRLYHIQADFRDRFEFRDYPFDQQELAVRFQHASQPRDRLIYVVDRVGMGRTSSPSLLGQWGVEEAFGSLGYWQPVWAGLFQDVDEATSSLGHPLRLGADADRDASRFNLVMWIKRDALNFTIKNLFPVFIVVGVAYLVFFIPPKELGTRLGIGTSTLLTTAFFDLSLSSHLPDIGYVVAIEYFFYVVYLLAVLGILVTIAAFIETKSESHGEKEALIQRLNLAGKILHPAVILITFAVYAYHYRLIGLFLPS